MNKSSHFLLSISIIFLFSCATNPNTGQRVVSWGSEMTWDLTLTYEHNSDNLANDLVGILTDNGYTVSLFNANPLIINTNNKMVGDIWIGMQDYRLIINSTKPGQFVVRIQPIMPLSTPSNPVYGDGMLSKLFDPIYHPLHKAFTEAGWHRKIIVEDAP